MKAIIKQEENLKSKVTVKKSTVATDCLQQAADWLGLYSRILENLQMARVAR